MKRKFDFVLSQNSYHRDIFRFYPRSSDVHSFNDDPPKNWDEVYKVYYSWAIIRQYFDDDIEGKIASEESEVLLDMGLDECSRIPELSEIIKSVILTGKPFDYPTFGQPAGDWYVAQGNGRYDWDKNKYDEDYKYYNFRVFNNWTNQGYRFTLDKEIALKFCDYLDMINDYALKHGKGI